MASGLTNQVFPPIAIPSKNVIMSKIISSIGHMRTRPTIMGMTTASFFFARDARAQRSIPARSKVNPAKATRAAPNGEVNDPNPPVEPDCPVIEERPHERDNRRQPGNKDLFLPGRFGRAVSAGGDGLTSRFDKPRRCSSARARSSASGSQSCGRRSISTIAQLAFRPIWSGRFAGASMGDLMPRAQVQVAGNDAPTKPGAATPSQNEAQCRARHVVIGSTLLSYYFRPPSLQSAKQSFNCFIVLLEPSDNLLDRAFHNVRRRTKPGFDMSEDAD